jgi:transcriptional regulator with XRE-family HTH domain
MEQPNLGKRISELRKAKGLTQEELAEQCKISARTLQRIEAGAVAPRSYTVRVIFAALKEDSSFMKLHFEKMYSYLKDLFNLKINTMKKVSILSAAVVATGFGLFALCSESKAQTDISKKYVKDNSRGVLILRPKGLLGYGQYYRNDTLFLHAGKDLIKECNGNVYLNDRFSGRADEGDTVILHKATFLKKAKLEFRRVEYQKIPGYKGAIFIFPKYPLLRMAHNDKMYYWSGNYEVSEKDNQIFLNGAYQGEAIANDTVILRPRGTLIIKSANRAEN